MNNFKTEKHHFYLSGSSWLCIFCNKGFSIYDVRKEDYDFMETLDCVNNYCEIKSRIDNHYFIINNNDREFYCKYCDEKMFSNILSRDEDNFANCISDNEKIIKDLLE